ncbi:MAG: hypothetical protein M0P94_02940 [Candidatus Absconditabacterales bacterium]|nr:hypothetical protein [Candidatus Absconditabacterales bacterium]
MLLLIVLIILIASLGILGNIYFHFFAFQQNFQDLNNYQNSYYASISSIERGLLSSKYVRAGYDGSGGFLGTGYWGNISDLLSNFGKITNGSNGLYFDINSKTKKVIGKINYDKITTILLSLNDSEDTYSSGTNIKKFFEDNDVYISGYIKNNFSSINETDKIQLKWFFVLNNENGYIIAGNTGNEISNGQINNGVHVYFSNETNNIFDQYQLSDSVSFESSGVIFDNIGEALSGQKAIMLGFYITGNYLFSNNKIVPYLDFEIESNLDFVDSHYYITGVSIYGKYKQNLSIKKPVSNYQNPNYKNFIFPYYNE